MIQTQHDEQRRRRLLTQNEVSELAGCSTGCLQYHVRHGWLAGPSERLHARFYFTEQQAREIAAYFAARNRWQRIEPQEKQRVTHE